jgi:HTH-type transcriptional regulator, fmd operon transcriptional regulator
LSGLQRQLSEESAKKFAAPKLQLGYLTEKQFRILELRSRGFSQIEIARELNLSRASVSMIEGRAKKKVEKAKQTLKICNLIQTQHDITIEAGVRLLEIPMLVLQAADREGIHLRSNMVDILKMIKSRASNSLSPEGRTIKKLALSFNERGKLSFQSPENAHNSPS